MKLARVLPIVVSLFFVAQGAFAQKATPAQMGKLGELPQYGTMHLVCNLGSYKIYGEGTATINFTGTLLISKMKGDMTYTGDIKKEYEGIDRIVLHGKGQVKVSGVWRAIQWFGSNLDTVWYGAGLVRLYGEFDKDLKTGQYWFDDLEDKRPWPSIGMAVELPEKKVGVAPGITPRKGGGG